jgi:hypothetical protein
MQVLYHGTYVGNVVQYLWTAEDDIILLNGPSDTSHHDVRRYN